MPDYFIDTSRATNGNGSMLSPFNTLSFTANNRYWVRRTIEASSSTAQLVIPSNCVIIGWPKLGDRFYNERPTNIAWDTDVSDYVHIKRLPASYVVCNLVSKVNIYLARFKLELAAGAVYDGVGCIAVTTCSRIIVENCYMMRTGTNYINVGIDQNALFNTHQSSHIQVTDVVGYRANLWGGGDGETLAILRANECNFCSFKLSALTDDGTINISSPWAPSNRASISEIRADNCNTCSFDINYHYEAAKIDHAGYYFDGNKSCVVTITYTNTVPIVDSYCSCVISDTNKNCSFDLASPEFAGALCAAGAGNAMTLRTNKITGRWGGGFLASLSVYGTAALKVLSIDGTGVAFPTMARSHNVNLDYAASCYIDKVANELSINSTTSLPSVLQYYDINDIYRVKTNGYIAKSASVSRVGGAASLEIESTVATATNVLYIGTRQYTPFSHTLPAGNYSARFYLAGIGSRKRLRQGQVLIKMRRYSEAEPEFRTAGNLQFVPIVWSGLTDYVSAYIDLPIEMPENGIVEFSFEFIFGTRLLDKIYLDPVPEITTL